MFEKFKNKVLLKPNLFTLTFFLVILFGILLRFQLLTNFVINSDSARDILIAGEALHRREIPLNGIFSSAGPFVIGPIYLWILMLSLIIFPVGVASAWILYFFIGIAALLIITYLGFLIGGKRLALILALLSATSGSFVNLSLNESNTTLVIITTLLLILFFILFIRKKKLLYAFLCGISIGLAINMHYQAINLLIFLPFIFFIRGIGMKKKIISASLIIAGLLIPLLPLLYWDSQQNFANINNILDYFLIVQYRIYVPNSWKIYILKDMSYFWGNVSGGSKALGFVGMGLVGITGLLGLLNIRKIRIKQEVILLAFMFFILLFLNRFYHAIRAEVYLLYFLPFILIFIAFSFNYLIELFGKTRIKYLIYVLLVIFFLGNLHALTLIFKVQKSNIATYKKPLNDLQKLYPGQKFSLYDWGGENYFESNPLSFVMFYEGLQSKDGMKIAVECIPNKNCHAKYRELSNFAGHPVTDISTLSAKTIERDFVNMNRYSIHDSLMGYTKKHALKSTFSLKNYLLGKF